MVLPFPRRDDASIGHHTPFDTSVHLLLSTSNNADNHRHRVRVPSKMFCRAELTSYHRTSLTSVQAIGLSGIKHKPQSTSTGHCPSVYVHECHSTNSGIETSQDTRLPELLPSDTGMETAVRRSNSTYSNAIERVRALLGSRMLFVAQQPRRTQLQERE